MGPHIVTLTFDNGPVAGITDAVLDELRARCITATFFVVGREVARPGGRDLLQRAIAEGHRIGNHSATHRTALGELHDPAAVDAEIDDCERLLDGLRSDPPLFRPFGNGGIIDYRLLSAHAIQRLRDGGYTAVLWNSVPHDWDDALGWVDTAMAHVMALTHSVVVLHDTPGAALARLPEFLDRLTAAGVTFSPEFPDDCVAIRGGVPTEVLAALNVGPLRCVG